MQLPWLKGSFRPAKALRALRVAFAQGFRGKWLAGDRFDFGIVLETEGERVHPAGPCRFVDCTFERNRSRRLAGRAHEQRRAGIGPDRLVRGGNRRTRIKRMRGVGGGLEEIVERARRDLRVMVDRSQNAIGIGADAHPLAGSRTMAHGTIHLFTAQHEFDRPADQPCCKNAEHLRPLEQTFRAEAATEIWTANMDFVRRNAEQSRDPRLRHRHALARRIDRQRIAIPRRHDRMRLHCIVVLRRRLIGRVDAR